MLPHVPNSLTQPFPCQVSSTPENFSKILVFTFHFFQVSSCFFVCLFVLIWTSWHMRSQSPDQGPNQSPLHWKRGVLTTGLPGESPKKLSKHTDIAIFPEEFQLNASIFF